MGPCDWTTCHVALWCCTINFAAVWSSPFLAYMPLKQGLESECGHCVPHSLRKTANELYTKQYMALHTLVGDSHKCILNIGNIASYVYGNGVMEIVCIYRLPVYSQVFGYTSTKGIKEAINCPGNMTFVCEVCRHSSAIYMFTVYHYPQQWP